MRTRTSREAGFTLVEMLIVVLIVGIVGTVAVPSYMEKASSTKEESLRRNLSILRDAIEYYYHQHNATYPGCVSYTDGASVPADAADRATSYIYQLTYPSTVSGKVNPATQDRPAGAEFGPYVTGWKMASNPLPDKDAKALLSAALTEVERHNRALAAGGENAQGGWKFNCQTGQFIANSDDVSSDGVTQYQYWGNNFGG